MQIYPAMDLINGECVRLYQGDFAQKTVYQISPIEVAQNYARLGSKWLHVVDLDGAKDPAKRQLDLLDELVKATPLSVQVGGGVRSADQIEALLALGAKRVMIGSMAVTAQAEVARWLTEFGPERILLTLDTHINQAGTPMATTLGWQETSEVSIAELITYYQAFGLSAVLCTDIACDGTLTGPNVPLYQTLMRLFPRVSFIASGGVSGERDVCQLQDAGLAGVVIGKAFYEGHVDLGAVLCH